MTNSTSREAFEAYMAKYTGTLHDVALRTRIEDSSVYAAYGVNAMWAGWQARQPEIDALQARIAELEAAQQWQPIETAPKDGRFILVAPAFGTSEQPYQVRWFVSKRIERWEFSGIPITANPTHWMPLPKPPTKE